MSHTRTTLFNALIFQNLSVAARLALVAHSLCSSRWWIKTKSADTGSLKQNGKRWKHLAGQAAAVERDTVNVSGCRLCSVNGLVLTTGQFR